jgi:hypothetical protein
MYTKEIHQGNDTKYARQFTTVCAIGRQRALHSMFPRVGHFRGWARDREGCSPALVFKQAIANCTRHSSLDTPDDITMHVDQLQLVEYPRFFWIMILEPLQTLEKGVYLSVLYDCIHKSCSTCHLHFMLL